MNPKMQTFVNKFEKRILKVRKQGLKLTTRNDVFFANRILSKMLAKGSKFPITRRTGKALNIS